jgi:hypothetical protein
VLSLSPGRVLYEVTLPVPHFLLSLDLAHLGFARLWVVPAPAASFFVFLTALRLVHNDFHYALGLPRPVTELWMFLLTSEPVL